MNTTSPQHQRNLVSPAGFQFRLHGSGQTKAAKKFKGVDARKSPRVKEPNHAEGKRSRRNAGSGRQTRRSSRDAKMGVTAAGSQIGRASCRERVQNAECAERFNQTSTPRPTPSDSSHNRT